MVNLMIIQFSLKLDRFCCIVELTEKDFFIDFTSQLSVTISLSYYQFNREQISQKAKERYSKEKSAEYYAQNKEAIKQKSKN